VQRLRTKEQQTPQNRPNNGAAFLIDIWKVPGSHLGPQTGYPD